VQNGDFFESFFPRFFMPARCRAIAFYVILKVITASCGPFFLLGPSLKVLVFFSHLQRHIHWHFDHIQNPAN